MRHTDQQVGVVPLPASDDTPAPLDCQGKRNKLQPIPSSDFGIEIGGSASFDQLPRYVQRVDHEARRKLCAACHQHRALFRYRGEVRYDRHHNLCVRCFRSAMDRRAASLVAERVSR